MRSAFCERDNTAGEMQYMFVCISGNIIIMLRNTIANGHLIFEDVISFVSWNVPGALGNPSGISQKTKLPMMRYETFFVTICVVDLDLPIARTFFWVWTIWTILVLCLSNRFIQQFTIWGMNRVLSQRLTSMIYVRELWSAIVWIKHYGSSPFCLGQFDNPHFNIFLIPVFSNSQAFDSPLSWAGWTGPISSVLNWKWCRVTSMWSE